MILTKAEAAKVRRDWKKRVWTPHDCPHTRRGVLVEKAPAKLAAARMPTPNGDPNGRVGDMIFNTNPFVADGQTRQLRWDVPLWVRLLSVRIWWGVQASSPKVDLHAEVFDLGTGCSVAPTNGDHYAEGSLGAGAEWHNFAPHYVSLPPGSGLLLNYQANAGAAHPIAHCIVWGFWVYAPPPS
jgi:hypothetical protein